MVKKGDKRGPYKPIEAIPGAVRRLRDGYEIKGLGSRKLAAKYGYPVSSIDFLIRARGWVLGRLKKPGKPVDPGELALAKGFATKIRKTITSGPVTPPSLASTLPEEATPNVAKAESTGETENPREPPSIENARPKKKARKSQTGAQIIPFPGGVMPSTPTDPGIRVLPGPTMAERSELRMTLAKIRSMMTVQQVQTLQRHKGVLSRYTHLIDVYLDPERFTDVKGLEEPAAGDKIQETQRLALRMLLPTERDTLNGAIKTLTAAVVASIELERRVVGLSLKALDPGRLPPPGLTLDGDEDEPRKATGTLGSMPTPQLRQVRLAMELLDRHQHANVDAPKPPPPDPIDDIFDAEPPESPR